MTPEKLAKLFHETYERLAPCFGYTTRPDSAVPWEKAPEKNRRLMVAVADFVLEMLTAEAVGPIDWTSFTPREIFAALKAAPKVAGPWSTGSLGGPGRSVRSLPVRGVAAFQDDDGECFIYPRADHHASPASNGPFASRAEADARLRELGWLLVDEPVAP